MVGFCWEYKHLAFILVHKQKQASLEVEQLYWLAHGAPC